MVVKVFITMLAKQDRDHVVRANAYNIARWALKTEEEVLSALKVLSRPDRKRKEPQPHDGRRIQRVEDGWLLLNGEKYQRMMMDMFRRAKKADWARRNREEERQSKTTATSRDEAVDAAADGVMLAGAGKTDQQAIEDEVREARDTREGKQIGGQQ